MVSEGSVMCRHATIITLRFCFASWNKMSPRGVSLSLHVSLDLIQLDRMNNLVYKASSKSVLVSM